MPKGGKLKPDEVATLVAWVKIGREVAGQCLGADRVHHGVHRRDYREAARVLVVPAAEDA